MLFNTSLLKLAEESDTTQDAITKTSEFSNFEIIFWYSALAIMIILFILYKKFAKSPRKKFTKHINKVSESINELDSLILKTDSTTPFLEYNKGNRLFVNINTALIKLEDKMKIPEIDKANLEISKIKKDQKNKDNLSYKEYLELLKKDYNELLDTLLVLVKLVK